MTAEFMSDTVAMAANQGIYNILLALVAVYGIIKKDWGVCVLSTVLVIIAAVFGAVTINIGILLKQGILPIAALIIMIIQRPKA